ncbi:MAG: dipeptidase, partial [Acidobacteria bacterium]
MQRRKFLKAGSAALVAPLLNFGRFRLFAESSASYSARCLDLVQRSLVIDMLNQFKLGAFPDVLDDRQQATARWWSHPQTFTPNDLARYKQSGISVFHIGWGTGREDPFNGAVKVLQVWSEFIAHFSADFVEVQKAEDFAALKRQGKLGILLGFQGSDHFRSTDDVAFFRSLGQRVSQLTYNQ